MQFAVIVLVQMQAVFIIAWNQPMSADEVAKVNILIDL